MRKKVFVHLISLFFFGFGCLNVNAHEIRPGYLSIVQIEQGTYDVFWKIPSIGNAVPDIYPVFPDSFNVETTELPNQIAGTVIYSYRISSDEELYGKVITISGLKKTLIDVLVNVDYLNGDKVTFMLQPDRDSQVIPGKSSKFEVVKTYLLLGVEHILLGIDHLLFVLALILITKGKWRIIKTVTAFTIAHSITLSLAALGIVSFASAPVEAVIALSIVFLALEALKIYKGEETLTSRKPWLIAFTFGLLHGFGFAGALSEIGLPRLEIPFALASFNVGVEIGQILFVMAILILSKILMLKKKLAGFGQKSSDLRHWVLGRILGYRKSITFLELNK